jgi:hypothetical protein
VSERPSRGCRVSGQAERAAVKTCYTDLQSGSRFTLVSLVGLVFPQGSRATEKRRGEVFGYFGERYRMRLFPALSVYIPPFDDALGPLRFAGDPQQLLHLAIRRFLQFPELLLGFVVVFGRLSLVKKPKKRRQNSRQRINQSYGDAR